MNSTAALLTIAFILIAFLLMAALFIVRRRSVTRPIAATEFVFSTPQDIDRQKFIYEVAGLIKAATGLQTHIVALGKYEGLDVEVHRGMRCVGVVSIVQPGENAPVSARLRAIARSRDEKGVRTAYLVSAGQFSNETCRQAKQMAVTLLDGAALKRIDANARSGRYIKRQEAPPPLTESEARRWRRPAVAPVHPAANANLDTTQERKEPKAPWVEYR